MSTSSINTKNQLAGQPRLSLSTCIGFAVIIVLATAGGVALMILFAMMARDFKHNFPKGDLVQIPYSSLSR